MRFVDLIEKKRNGLALSHDEIQWWIDSYVKGEIPDYQVSALLMAILFKGMNRREIKDLTLCMMHSGDVMNLDEIHRMKVDKHSTGGVGDKTSLVLAPMIASCGIAMVKMSGRGLGFTGGTIDKLEAIDGFKVNLDREAVINQVNKIGVAIVSQTGNLVPADKKLYALRDVTDTVSSIPLIASSIMSKKLAAGSDVIVLDVKYGSGAFMKTAEDAVLLAQTMIDIGTDMGKKVRAVISSMEAPLGFAIGNALEVVEAIHTLHYDGPKDLTELCLVLGSLILIETGVASDEASARKMLQKVLEDGEALNKLIQMVEAQGGDKAQIINPNLLPKANYQTPILAQADGFIHNENAMELGRLAMEIGAGRATKDDDIWKEVGIVLQKKPGDCVKKGEILAMIHHRVPLSQEWLDSINQAFVISSEQPNIQPLIYKIL